MLPPARTRGTPSPRVLANYTLEDMQQNTPGMLIGQVDEVCVDGNGKRRDAAYPEQSQGILLLSTAGEIEHVERMRNVVVEIHHLICTF